MNPNFARHAIVRVLHPARLARDDKHSLWAHLKATDPDLVAQFNHAIGALLRAEADAQVLVRTAAPAVAAWLAADPQRLERADAAGAISFGPAGDPLPPNRKATP